MTGFFSSLRVRLLSMVFFAALPALAIIIYSGWDQRQLAKDTAGKEMFHKIRIIASFQKMVFEEVHKELAILAELHTIQEHKPETCSAVLGELLKSQLEYVNLGVADRRGKVICSALPMEKEITLADRSYFHNILKTGHFAVGTYQIDLISCKVSVGAGYPIFDRQGKIEAVIFASLDLTWLEKMLAESSQGLFDPQANITVIDQGGTVLARWPGGAQWVGVLKPDADIIKTVLTQGEGTAEAYGLDGIHKIYAFSPLDRNRQVGFIYAGLPTTALYVKMNRYLARNLICLGLAISLAFVAAWFFSSQIVLSRTSPLLNAAKRISAGDLSARTGLSYGKGELDDLARSFDEMAKDLQAREKELQFTNRILIIANQARNIEQLFRGFITEIKSYTRCGALGIRVLGEHGQAPYQPYEDCAQKFDEMESLFSIEIGACLGVNGLKEKTDLVLSYCTEGGSFFLNQITEFIASVLPEKKGVGNNLGYESVALVPLRVGSQILGSIHVADSQENMVPVRIVENLEKTGMRLGQALVRLRAEEQLSKKTHDLGERVKELHCLYNIARLMEVPNISLDEIIQRVLELIPPAWQYPDITCARITFEGRTFRSVNFKETRWKQAIDILVYGDCLGRLEVYYQGEKPTLDEGPFQKEERHLLETIAKALGAIIEGKQAEKKLRESEQNLRYLASQLLTAQEQEKHKISLELHDTVAQELATFKIDLENLQLDLPEKSVEEFSQRISQILQKLQQTLTAIRTLSYDLRPPELEHLGLVRAIELHCAEFSARTGIKVDFTAAGIEAAALDYDAAINLYRIIQEGLTNVWRHAQAEKVTIKLVASFPKIILRLEDDGRGFDVSGQEISATPTKHMGLLGIRERAALLGGEMSIESQLEKGTKIILEIPWQGEGFDSKEKDPHR